MIADHACLLLPHDPYVVQGYTKAGAPAEKVEKRGRWCRRSRVLADYRARNRGYIPDASQVSVSCKANVLCVTKILAYFTLFGSLCHKKAANFVKKLRLERGG